MLAAIDRFMLRAALSVADMPAKPQAARLYCLPVICLLPTAMKIVPKPWGRELWIAHTDKYAMKIIEIKKGTRCSLQYHIKKHEHIYVDSGMMKVEWENEQGEMEDLVLVAGRGDREQARPEAPDDGHRGPATDRGQHAGTGRRGAAGR